jgi:hypothetical protein
MYVVNMCISLCNDVDSAMQCCGNWYMYRYDGRVIRKCVYMMDLISRYWRAASQYSSLVLFCAWHRRTGTKPAQLFMSQKGEHKSGTNIAQKRHTRISTTFVKFV